MNGAYRRCPKIYLHRYMASFEFRYSNRSAISCEDQLRALRAVLGGTGKRLIHRTPNLATVVAA